MKKLLVILLLIPFIATAEPTHSMVGKPLKVFMEFIPFSDQENECIGGTGDFTINFREYSIEKGDVIRQDVFVGAHLKAFYMPYNKMAYIDIDGDGYIDKEQKYETMRQANQCEIGRME